jgi:hypothetical protein
MKRYWFKAKTYGYGWYPATWEGWAVLTGFIVAALYNVIRIDAVQDSGSGTLVYFIPQTLILVGVLIGICYVTGEDARWRWPKK